MRAYAAAASHRPDCELVRRRVRVRLHADPNGPAVLTAFAAVEQGVTGACLRLRRGSDILTSINIGTLRVSPILERMLALMPEECTSTSVSAMVYFSFETDARLAKLQGMLQEARGGRN